MLNDKVIIEEELNKKLSRISTTKSFFKNLDLNFPKIIIGFTNVKFISRRPLLKNIFTKKII